LVFGASALLGASATLAADATNTPARRFGPPQLLSPEVHADRTVTFRVRAPNATNVTVSGEWPGAKTLTNDTSGNWSVTFGPLAPELYGYSFSIDGFQTLDLGNPAVKPSRSPRTSILEVPGQPPSCTSLIQMCRTAWCGHIGTSRSRWANGAR